MSNHSSKFFLFYFEKSLFASGFFFIGGIIMRAVFLPKKMYLVDALNSSKVFFEIESMLRYLVYRYGNNFSVQDIYLSYYAYDDRLKATLYNVCVRRFGNDSYSPPYVIGFCCFNIYKKKLVDNASSFLYGDCGCSNV